MKYLTKIDKYDIPLDNNEIRLVTVIKNERLRIPYLIKYYKELGVDRFFIIDHFSNDGWYDAVKKNPAVHVFNPKTKKGFAKGKWKHDLMLEYCVGHWTIIVDPDELLIYPNCEKQGLKELCKFMEYEKANVLRSSFLDVYSPLLLKDAIVKENQNPLEVLTCFDNPPIKFYSYGGKSFKNFRSENTPLVEGGILYRVANHLLFLNKVCLFKFDKTMSVLAGHHLIRGKYIKSSALLGSVLHTKYSADINDFVNDEKVNNYSSRGIVYQKYKSKGLGSDPLFTFDTLNSTVYTGSLQLVDLGIIKTNEKFNWKGWVDLHNSTEENSTPEYLEPNLSKNSVKTNTLIKFIQKENPKTILDTSFKAGYTSCIMLNACNELTKLYAIGEDSKLEQVNREIIKREFPSASITLSKDLIEAIKTIKEIKENIDFALVECIEPYFQTIKLFENVVNKLNKNGIMLVNNCQYSSVKAFLDKSPLEGFSEIYINVNGEYPLRAFRKVEDIPCEFDIESM